MPKFIYGTDNLDIIGMGGIGRNGATDGDDWIFGLGGDDWIFGLDGNDFLFGGEGADKLFGGDDIDTAITSNSPYGVTVDLQAGKGHGGTAEGDLLYSIENLVGSWWGDHLTGNANDNVLSGLGGNDDLEGGAGADTLEYSQGIDRAIYSNSPAGVIVSLLWGSASGSVAEGDKLISIESLYGSEYDDGLFGDNGANSNQGYLGDDVLLGYGDKDFLEGSDSYDALWGGFGNDLLVAEKMATPWPADPAQTRSSGRPIFWGANTTAAVFSLRATLTGRTWMWSWISPLGRTRSTWARSMLTR